jgi:hypothetical protein
MFVLSFCLINNLISIKAILSSTTINVPIFFDFAHNSALLSLKLASISAIIAALDVFNVLAMQLLLFNSLFKVIIGHTPHAA